MITPVDSFDVVSTSPIIQESATCHIAGEQQTNQKCGICYEADASFRCDRCSFVLCSSCCKQFYENVNQPVRSRHLPLLNQCGQCKKKAPWIKLIDPDCNSTEVVGILVRGVLAPAVQRLPVESDIESVSDPSGVIVAPGQGTSNAQKSFREKTRHCCLALVKTIGMLLLSICTGMLYFAIIGEFQTFEGAVETGDVY